MQTIQIKIDESNVDFFIELIKKLNIVTEIKIDDVLCLKNKEKKNKLIISPEGEPSISDFQGFWIKKPKTLEQIREKAWKRN